MIEMESYWMWMGDCLIDWWELHYLFPSKRILLESIKL